MDYYINKNGNCTHEYGVKNINGRGAMCLDCGKILLADDIKKVYTLNDDSFHGLSGYLAREDADVESLSMVRDSYLRLLLESSVCDSFTTLVKKYNLK